MLSHYSFLRNTFEKFLIETTSSIQAEHAHAEGMRDYLFRRQGEERSPYRQFLQSLGLTEEEFEVRFLSPWKDLTAEQVQEVIKYWNFIFSGRKKVLLGAMPINEHLALQWTLVNVVELNISGLELFRPDYEEVLAQESAHQKDIITYMFVSPEHALPQRQCHFCGRLDKDPRGNVFGHKGLRFCHLENCPSGSNASNHEVHCCWATWRRLKMNFRTALDRCGPDKSRAKKIFQAFCERRYQENLQMQIPVRPAQEKRTEWKLVFEPKQPNTGE